MRLGRLPYLNAWPYRAAWPVRGNSSGPPCFIEAAPRELGERAAAGELDAAPLASRDALALADRFRPLPFGIACDGPVTSVLLFSRYAPRRLGGRRIALSCESRTSRGLLRLLLAAHFEVEEVSYVNDEQPADARLVIGDSALTLARLGESWPGTAWPFVLDLGAAWREWTGLPFVYARWVVRRDRPTSAATLASDLDRALRRGSNLPPRDLPPGVDGKTAQAYLRRLTYRLGPREEAGYERFHLELDRHDLLDHHLPTRQERRAA